MSNDPNRNKGLKAKMKELSKKYAEEEEAIAATEPSTEEKKEAKAKIDKKIEDKRKKDAGEEVEDPNKAKITAQETANETTVEAYSASVTKWTDHKATAKPEDEAGLLGWNKKEETFRQAKITANITKLKGELALATLKEDKEKVASLNGLIQGETTALANKESFPALNSAGKTDVADDDEVESGEDDALARAEADDKIEADKAAAMAKGKEEQGDDPNAEPESGEDDALARAEADDKIEADKAAAMAKGKEEQGDDPNAKDAKLATAKAALTKAEESGDEVAIKAAKDALAAIEAKENWQLDGTRLGGMLDARVSKIKSDAILTESKYQSQSIKDRLSRLL
jgi:hypothetical protein